MKWHLKFSSLIAVCRIVLCGEEATKNENGDITLTTCKEVEENAACRLTCKTPDLKEDIVFENYVYENGEFSCRNIPFEKPDCTTNKGGYSLRQDTNASMTYLDITNFTKMLDGFTWTCKYGERSSNKGTIFTTTKSTTIPASRTAELDKQVLSDVPDRSHSNGFDIVYIVAPVAVTLLLFSSFCLMLRFRESIKEWICRLRYQRATTEDNFDDRTVNTDIV